MDRKIERVVPLEELRDQEMAAGEPDVRGWEVIAGDGTRLGEVDDLLVESDVRQVRFLDVAVDEDLVGDAGKEQHLLVPIASARLDQEEDQVFVDGLTSTSVFPGAERREGELPDDDGGDERQQADAPVVVERERAIVELDPPERHRGRDEMRDSPPDRR